METHKKLRSCYFWLKPTLAKRRQSHDRCLLTQAQRCAPWAMPPAALLQHGSIINGTNLIKTRKLQHYSWHIRSTINSLQWLQDSDSLCRAILKKKGGKKECVTLHKNINIQPWRLWALKSHWNWFHFKRSPWTVIFQFSSIPCLALEIHASIFAMEHFIYAF